MFRMALPTTHHESIKEDVLGLLVGLNVSTIPYAFSHDDLTNTSTIQILMSSILVHLCLDKSPWRASGIEHGLELLSSLLGCNETLTISSEKRTLRRVSVINFVARSWGFSQKLVNVLEEPVSVSLKPLKLTTGRHVPLGTIRRAIVRFFHDILVASDAVTLRTITKLSLLPTLVDLFWAFPYNSMLHVKVKAVILLLLRSNVLEAVQKLILETDFILKAITFLQNVEKNKCSSLRVSLVEMMECWDSVQTNGENVVSEAMTEFANLNPKMCEEWEHHIWFCVNPLSKPILLGGVPRPMKGDDSLRKPKKRKHSRRNSLIMPETSSDYMDYLMMLEI